MSHLLRRPTSEKKQNKSCQLEKARTKLKSTTEYHIMLRLTNIKENEQKAGTGKVCLRSPFRCKRTKTILGQILQGTTTSV